VAVERQKEGIVLLKIVQVGEAVLRTPARPLARDEILDPSLQRLIALMRDTMHDAPGVGLAAPQIGESIQLAVIEDRSESMRGVSSEQLRERERAPVDFRVLINPQVTVEDPTPVGFFEGCLSVAGFVAAVPRAKKVRVEALDERAEPIRFSASGWFARIVQHEVDHLQGTLYLDRMLTRTFMTSDNFGRYWRDASVEEIIRALGLNPG
jgi:peptide deformylase